MLLTVGEVCSLNPRFAVPVPSHTFYAAGVSGIYWISATSHRIYVALNVTGDASVDGAFILEPNFVVRDIALCYPHETAWLLVPQQQPPTPPPGTQPCLEVMSCGGMPPYIIASIGNTLANDFQNPIH